MNSVATAPAYRERLVPGIGLFAACLLIVPAVALILVPVAAPLAIPVSISVYVLLVIALLLLSPTIRVAGGILYAGRAQIPVEQLGEIELLGAQALREAIGPNLDARSYLVIRGWIHRGVRITNIDPADPAPYWIITSRRPQALAEAIEGSHPAAS
ncbi:MAG: DUF3093 domain-containing protein [Leucobacter sp.]